MSLLNSILGAMSQQSGDTGSGTNPIVAALSGLLEQSGGLQGLQNKFAQQGQGDAFASWVGTGQNQPVSSNAIQQVLGSEQVRALAARFGVNPDQAAQLLAQFLPQVIDRLTPKGQIDPNTDHQQGLAAALPSLLQSFMGGPTAGR